MKDKLIKRKRIIAIVSALIFIGVAAYVTYFVWRLFDAEIDSPEAFKAYIDSFGMKGYLVAFGIQVLQVFVALIPGEVVEIGLGYVFGWFGGTLVCLLGVALASSAIFLLVKKLGRRMVELFVDPQKIDNLRFLNSDKKLDGTVFLLYFIPGTPKDLLVYFIGLTRMTLSRFLLISMIARLPSVISSILVGHFAVEQNYVISIVIFGITAIISLVGLIIYNKFVKNKQAASSDQKPQAN